MRKKFIRSVMIVIFVLMLTGCGSGDEVYLETYCVTEQAESEVCEAEQTVIREEAQEQVYYVYVCGAVKKPGVYSLPAGSRIFEAIELAGGLTEDADDCSINLASELVDGMLLRVYTCEETDESAPLKEAEDVNCSIEDSRVDINTASVPELMQLPGVGKAKAEAIVEYRTENGMFSKIEDLMKIPGIKEGIFEQIKEQIKVNEKR